MSHHRTSHMQSARAKTGNAGEQHAAAALRRLGVLMVEEIGTPFVIINQRPGGWVKGYWKEKVSGDLRGHTEAGISVLAEVKTHWNGSLTWSAMREHQPERLSTHAEHAISLLIWVHSSGIHVLRWPVPGFDGPRTSITPEQAQELAITYKLWQ